METKDYFEMNTEERRKYHAKEDESLHTLADQLFASGGSQDRDGYWIGENGIEKISADEITRRVFSLAGKSCGKVSKDAQKKLFEKLNKEK